MFRDVVVSSTGSRMWLDHRLVRLTFRGLHTRDPFQSVKALDGLNVEYQVREEFPYHHRCRIEI